MANAVTVRGHAVSAQLPTSAAGPRLLGSRAHDLENLVDLIDLAIPREEWPLGHHLGHNGPHGPQVHGQRVSLGAQQDLRGAVPEGHHLVCEGTDGGHEGASQAEIRQFELSVTRDQEVLGLEITGLIRVHMRV